MTPRGVGLLIWAAASSAQPCPTVNDVAAERSDQARLHFLSAQLLAESHRANTWAMAWGTTAAVLTVGQVAAVPLIIPQDRVEWWVGAATTAVGLGYVSAGSLEVMSAGPDYARRANRPTDVCALIAEGEGLLERGAARESVGNRWFNHAANLAVNVGLGLILGLGYGHWVAAAVNFAFGVALGEATIFSAPSRLITAWKDYQRSELGPENSAVSFQVFPLLSPQGAGIGLALSF